MVPLLAAGHPRRAARKRAGQLLSRVGLEERYLTGRAISAAVSNNEWRSRARSRSIRR